MAGKLPSVPCFRSGVSNSNEGEGIVTPTVITDSEETGGQIHYTDIKSQATFGWLVGWKWPLSQGFETRVFDWEIDLITTSVLPQQPGQKV